MIRAGNGGLPTSPSDRIADSQIPQQSKMALPGQPESGIVKPL